MRHARVRRPTKTWLIAILIVLLPAVVPDRESRAQTPDRRQREAVHLVSAVKPNDPKLTEMLDEAVTSIRAGHEVVILFDGQSVGSLRMNAKKDNKTPLEETEFTERERQTLAERLALPDAVAPRNHFEYVQQLAKAGAKVFVNRNAIRLLGLVESEIHPIATPIPARQVADVLDQADLCYTYGH